MLPQDPPPLIARGIASLFIVAFGILLLAAVLVDEGAEVGAAAGLVEAGGAYDD